MIYFMFDIKSFLLLVTILNLLYWYLNFSSNALNEAQWQSAVAIKPQRLFTVASIDLLHLSSFFFFDAFK